MNKFIVELHALQYLFIMGSNRQQRKGAIISNLTKRKAFFISYNNQVLLGVISQCGPLLVPSKKRSSCPLHSGQEETISGHSFERRAYLFVLKATRVFPIPKGRVERG